MSTIRICILAHHALTFTIINKSNNVQHSTRPSMNSVRFYTTLLVAFMLAVTTYSQSVFFVDIHLNQQLVREDGGLNYGGQFSYRIHQDISIGVSASQAAMDNKDSRSYDLGKFGLQINYAFGNFDNFKFEAITGFSYLHFSEDIILEKNKGFGLDLGVQTVFRTAYKLNYGLRLVSTYSAIPLGGIVNAGVLVRYHL